MFNSDKPSLDQLPSTARLVKSTVLALLSAIAILVTVVLPAEYGIDPTGAGRVLGLTEMGEIKNELAKEAEEDRKMDRQSGKQSNLIDGFLGLFVSPAHASEGDGWKDEKVFTLKPRETAEFKLVMTEGQTAQFSMIVEGGRVNFDLHGHGSGKSATYEKGRGSQGSKGEFRAAFDGEHGWFWRNRNKVPVNVKIQVTGDYTEVKSSL